MKKMIDILMILNDVFFAVLGAVIALGIEYLKGGTNND